MSCRIGVKSRVLDVMKNSPYKCKSPKMKVIAVMEEEELEEEMGLVEIEDDQKEEIGLNQLVLQVEAVTGLTRSKTMKLMGELLGELMVILIDNGVTHNFITREPIRKCNLALVPIEKYKLIMGNGHHVSCEGECVDVSLKMQELEICG